MNSDKTVMIIEMDNLMRHELKQRLLDMGYKVIALGENINKLPEDYDQAEYNPDIVLFDSQIIMNCHEEKLDGWIRRYDKQATPIILLAPNSYNLVHGLSTQAQDFIMIEQWNQEIGENAECLGNPGNTKRHTGLLVNIPDNALENKINHWIELWRKARPPERNLIKTRKELMDRIEAGENDLLEDEMRSVDDIINETVPRGLPIKYLNAINGYAKSLLLATRWEELFDTLANLANTLGVNISFVSHDLAQSFSSQHHWYADFELEWLRYEIAHGECYLHTKHLCTAIMDHSHGVSLLYSTANYYAFFEVYWKDSLKLITSLTQLSVDKIRRCHSAA